MRKYLLLFLLLCASAASAQTIADKLTTINNIKLDIKAALASKSQTVGDDFSVYDDAVASISGSMFEIVATVNNAECGGTVTASQPAVICSPSATSPWIPVATAPVAAAYPSGAPSAYDNISMSGNGEYLAVVHTGTSAPKSLSTYKWNSTLNSFALTDDPTDPSGGQGGGIGMNADGSKFAVITYNGSTNNLQYYYWGTTGYLLGTEPADVANIAGRGIEMNGDGSRLVITNGATPYLTVYQYSAASGTYIQLTNPDSALPGYGYSVALDYSGDKMLADAHNGTAITLHYYVWDGSKYTKTGTTQPDFAAIGSATYIDMSMDGQYAAVALSASPYIATYKWDSVDNRFEKMANPTGINNAVNAASIASDGSKIILSGLFTSPNYFAILELDKAKNQYILVQNAASAPGSQGRACAMSGDSSRIAINELSANYLRLYNLSASYTGWFVYPLKTLGSALYPRYFGYAESSGTASDTVTFKAYWHQDEYTGLEE